jgi:hypothetical protein
MAASSAGLVTICSGPEEGYQARLAARWSTRHRSRRFRSGIQRKCRSAVCRALVSDPVRMRPRRLPGSSSTRSPAMASAGQDAAPQSCERRRASRRRVDRATLGRSWSSDAAESLPSRTRRWTALSGPVRLCLQGQSPAVAPIATSDTRLGGIPPIAGRWSPRGAAAVTRRRYP